RPAGCLHALYVRPRRIARRAWPLPAWRALHDRAGRADPGAFRALARQGREGGLFGALPRCGNERAAVARQPVPYRARHDAGGDEGARSGARSGFGLPARRHILTAKAVATGNAPMYGPDSTGGCKTAVMRRAGRVRILLIEDDAVLGEAVRDYVAGLGHAVDWMLTLDDGRASARAVDYDLVLLDLRLPDGSGLSLLTELRRSGAVTPVIILTAHDQISDRIEGLNSGADDYLVKPFNLGELGARMLAVARRYAGSSLPLLEAGSLTIQLADRRVLRDGRPVD